MIPHITKTTATVVSYDGINIGKIYLDKLNQDFQIINNHPSDMFPEINWEVFDMTKNIRKSLGV